MDIYTNPILSFWIAVIGTVTGVAGLCYSVLAWRAAVSARVAAQSAVNQIRGINVLVETSRLQMLCSEIKKLFDSKAYQLAKNSVRDVRHGVHQLKAHPHTYGYLEKQTWEQMTADLADIEFALTGAKDGQKFEEIRVCEQRISLIDENLILIMSKCQRAAEEIK